MINQLGLDPVMNSPIYSYFYLKLIFGILVQKSSQFDESMEIEGISAELPEAARSQDISKEDAIRSILNTDQLDKYNAKMESGGYGRGRGRGPWGRRGFGG